MSEATWQWPGQGQGPRPRPRPLKAIAKAGAYVIQGNNLIIGERLMPLVPFLLG